MKLLLILGLFLYVHCTLADFKKLLNVKIELRKVSQIYDEKRPLLKGMSLEYLDLYSYTFSKLTRLKRTVDTMHRHSEIVAVSIFIENFLAILEKDWKIVMKKSVKQARESKNSK